MAKHHEIGLDKYQTSLFTKAIRTKRDVIVLWMNSIKAFLAGQPTPDPIRQSTLCVTVMSMSRLFCETNQGRKIFSVAFPFTVQAIDTELQFRSREGIAVDHRVSSAILALVGSETTGILAASDFYHFCDPVLEAVEQDRTIWTLLRELMLAEDAYIRYDWDEDRANGHVHPTHHLDLGYSSDGTFKIGLNATIDRSALVDILNVEVDCHYLRPVGANAAAQ